MDEQKKRNKNAASKMRKLGVVWALIVLVAVGCIASPKFATSGNIINVARQISINGVIALCMTFVCLIGGVDLSVGSQVAVYSVVMAVMLKQNISPWIVIPLTLVIAIGIGLLNGLGVAKGHLAPFIMTLGSMTALRGVAKYICNGTPTNWRNTDINIRFIGQGYISFIPFTVVIFLVMFFLAYYVLKYTEFGRSVYAVGDNVEAARLNGINIQKIQIACFVLTALGAFVSALMLTSKLSSADPTAGEGYELTALSMCYIGGISTLGGVGSITGTLTGACLLSALSNIMNLVGINSYMQDITQGLIVIFAVLLGGLSSRTKKK